MPRNLLTAFKAYRGCSGAMCLPDAPHRVHRLFKEIGIPVIEDGLRNTFCSYTFCYMMSILQRNDAIEWLGRWMGNSAGQLILHRLNSEISVEEAIAFFRLVPGFLCRPLPSNLNVTSAVKLHNQRTATLRVARAERSTVFDSGCERSLLRQHVEAEVAQERLTFLPALPAKITSAPDPTVTSAFPCFRMPRRARNGARKKP